jgi:16S rRNA (cytosine1402-N4)-methyltransferase
MSGSTESRPSVDEIRPGRPATYVGTEHILLGLLREGERRSRNRHHSDSFSLMADNPTPEKPRRRQRYRGKNPRRFQEKYKERAPDRYPEEVAHVLAAGKTPAGSHRPIMVAEILQILAPHPREVAIDVTLGYGGHAEAILPHLLPGGHLFGLDADPIELPKTEARLRAVGFGPDVFTARRLNFAGLSRFLAEAGQSGVDLALADLGVSSMQLDDPARGFGIKEEGTLDMRMNPDRGESASALVGKKSAEALAALLSENADEPHALTIAQAIAGRAFATTTSLAQAIRASLPRSNKDDPNLPVRRVFQALRIAVNDEFSALDMLLRSLPDCLKPGGRVAILSFHSGEDRRVKKAFQAGARDGLYAEIAGEVIRASPAEQRANPRSTSAKLRWALRAAVS